MDITPLIPKDKNVINSYGPDGFKINQTIYQNTILLTPDQLIEIKVESVDLIDWKLLGKMIDLELEIILIGTGEFYKKISDKLKNEIKAIHPEASINEMTSSAACRTYNILISEDRKVAAILIPFISSSSK